MWADLTKDKAKDLRYIFRQAIVTPTSKEIMKQAAARAQHREYKSSSFYREKDWPGHLYKSGSEEFLALLGTPHGSGVAFLLSTHPEEMPGKSTESLSIFTTCEDCNQKSDYHMLWRLNACMEDACF